MTHICVSKLTFIGSDNGLSPDRRQAIIWTNDGILLIGPLETNGAGGHSQENFYSDADTNAGILMTRILRELSAENVAVYVAHQVDNNATPLPKKKKLECLASVIGAAMMSLTASEKPK